MPSRPAFSICDVLRLLLLPALVLAEESTVKLTFRNELSGPVEIYWEGPRGRIPQGGGHAIPPSGGDLTIHAYPGHVFSYDDPTLGGRHEFTVPRGHEDVFNVLLGGAPDLLVRCTTSVDGATTFDETFDVRVRPDWSPRGASRFLDLVRMGYYDSVPLNRVVPKFLTQFGIAADLATRTKWRGMQIEDDPKPDPPVPFQPGMFSYAGSGKDSRTTEIFVVMPGTSETQLKYFGANSWETPFAYLDGPIEDSPVPRWYAYGDMPPWGEGPASSEIYLEHGYEYLAKKFPNLDYLGRCFVVGDREVKEEEL